MRSTCLFAFAVALLGFSATNAAAQAPTVTWQQIGNGLRAEWTTIPGATHYEAFVDGVPAPVPILTNYFQVGPVPVGTYVLQIRAAAGNTKGPLSAPVTVVIGAAAPTCGAVSAPAVTVTTAGMNVSINWGAVAGAVGYRVQVGTTPGATQYQVDLPANQTNFSGPVPMLGTFYVRVLSGSPCGALAPSAEQSFTIGAATPGPSPAPPTGSGPRTPDPAPGQILPRPSYVADVVQAMARAYPGDLHNSCREHGGNNVFMFRVLAALRQRDSRFGLNYKRGQYGDLSQDIITYNPTDRPDNRESRIYLWDIIGGHCGNNPGPNWGDVTDVTWAQRGNPACGTEWCAMWTIEPYLRAGFPADPRQ